MQTEPMLKLLLLYDAVLLAEERAAGCFHTRGVGEEKVERVFWDALVFLLHVNFLFEILVVQGSAGIDSLARRWGILA